MTLGERLQYLRTKNKTQQKEIAEALGIKQSSLSNYETGFREPDVEMLNKIATYYDVTLDYLCGRTDHQHGMVRYDVPQELKGIGIEYIIVLREMFEKKLDPDEIRSIIDFYQSMKNKKAP